MKLYIKNMVCPRCITSVDGILKNNGIPFIQISLGEVDLGNFSIAEPTINTLSTQLEQIGFELLETKTARLIDKTKRLILSFLNQEKGAGKKINLSDFLKGELQYDYNYISNLFSSLTGDTIERYFILLRIEKVKELLIYDELTLSEIAEKLNYNSVAYLSNQFKKITGLTPTKFKGLKDPKARKSLDNL